MLIEAPPPVSRPAKPRLRLGVRATFDAAETSDLNRRHWAVADHRAADDTAGPEVRRTLRVRSRYEIQNNSIARGIALTLANDTIGTGPRLQLLTSEDAFNQSVERHFLEWSRAISLAGKLRTFRLARIQDGEGFGLLVRAPVAGTPVELDWLLVEADQVSSPDYDHDERNVDGVLLDALGRPVAYQVLTCHPGSAGAYKRECHTYDAEDMIHLFRADRPGQHRGIPEITPALPLFAQLRRYTLAVLSAAESAADFAVILYTDCPPDGEADPINPMDKVRLERNMMTTMPAGWKLGQLDPKQPAATYAEFKREILNEIARCLNIPFNVAAGNSSGYNYASGRLDHQTYFKAIRVDQDETASRVLDRLFAAFARELAVATDEIPPDWVRTDEALVRHLPHRWFWDGLEHVDPLKEANAAMVRLSSGCSSIPEEQSRRGVDYAVSARAAAKALGVTVPQYQALVRRKLFGTEEVPVVAGEDSDDDSGYQLEEPD